MLCRRLNGIVRANAWVAIEIGSSDKLISKLMAESTKGTRHDKRGRAFWKQGTSIASVPSRKELDVAGESWVRDEECGVMARRLEEHG